MYGIRLLFLFDDLFLAQILGEKGNGEKYGTDSYNHNRLKEKIKNVKLSEKDP